MSYQLKEKERENPELFYNFEGNIYDGLNNSFIRGFLEFFDDQRVIGLFHPYSDNPEKSVLIGLKLDEELLLYKIPDPKLKRDPKMFFLKQDFEKSDSEHQRNYQLYKGNWVNENILDYDSYLDNLKRNRSAFLSIFNDSSINIDILSRLLLRHFSDLIPAYYLNKELKPKFNENSGLVFKLRKM